MVLLLLKIAIKNYSHEVYCILERRTGQGDNAMWHTAQRTMIS